jgi:hypothetical protein
MVRSREETMSTLVTLEALVLMTWTAYRSVRPRMVEGW